MSITSIETRPNLPDASLVNAPRDIRESDFNPIQAPEIETVDKDTRMEDYFSDPSNMLNLMCLAWQHTNPFAEQQEDPSEQIMKFINATSNSTMSRNMQKMADLSEKNAGLQAMSMIGHKVEFEGNELVVDKDCSIQETFMIPEDTDAYMITVTNQAGEKVYETYKYNPKVGINNFKWDGENNIKPRPEATLESNQDENGVIEHQGEYKVSVTLLKRNGSDLESAGYAANPDGFLLNNCPKILKSADNRTDIRIQMPKGDDITNATIIIRNKENEIIKAAGFKTTSEGKEIFSWDGLDNNGKELKPGTYKIHVSSINSDNKLVNTKTQPKVYISGNVTGFEKSNSGLYEAISHGTKVPLDKIIKIVQ